MNSIRRTATCLAATLAVVAAPAVANAHHTPPSDKSLIKVYPKLYKAAEANPAIDEGRNVLLHGRPQDGRIVWAVVRSEAERLWMELHPKVKYEHERQRIYSAITEKRPTWPENKRIVYAWWMANGKPEADFHCLANIIRYENAGWVVTLDYGGGHGNVHEAYGIPQSAPGTKMASMGSDWQTNPITQIRWMIKYTTDSYGSPCLAWNFRARSPWGY